tara:strand:+ start:770 stop:3139 length:2370 start_codon:yes stop_codon:yes gene_type:complete
MTEDKISNISLIRWVYNPEKRDDRRCFDKHIANDSDSYSIKVLEKNRKQLQNCLTDTNELIEDKFNHIKYNQSLLEICNHKKYNKLWFDIDTFKLEYNEEEIQSILTDMFDKIDNIFGKKLVRETYLVYYKQTNSKYIHSLRIINYHYKITYEDSKILVSLLQTDKSTENLFIDNLDNRVYHMKRPIILPYNTKPYSSKYTDYDCFKDNGVCMYKPEESVNHYFIDFNYNSDKKKSIQTTKPKNYLISLISTEKLLKVKKTEEVMKLINTKTDILNSDYQTKLKEERIHKLLDCDKHTIVDELLANLNIKFYQSSKGNNWSSIMKCLKQLKIPDIDRDRFLKESAEISNHKNHTYKKNLEYWNKPLEEENNELYNYNTICKILTYNNSNYYYFTDYLVCNVKNITEWISDRIGKEHYNLVGGLFKELLDQTDRKELNKIKVKWVIDSEKYVYDFKSSNLYVGKNKLYNYTIEKEYWKKYEDNIETKNYDVEVDCITELDSDNKPLMGEDNKPVLNKEIDTLVGSFIKRYEDNLLVEVECGGGKSFYIQKKIIIDRCNDMYSKILSEKIGDNNGDNWLEILNWCKENKVDIKRILMVSCNNSLNKKEFVELKEISNTFTNHLEIQSLDKEIRLINTKVKEKEVYKCSICNWSNCDSNVGCQESGGYCEGKMDCKYCGCSCFINLKSKKRVLTRYCSMVCSLESIDKYCIGDNWNKNIMEFDCNKEECCDLLIMDEFNTIMSKFKVEQRTFKDLHKSWRHFKKISGNSKQRLVMDADIKPELLDIYCKVCE